MGDDFTDRPNYQYNDFNIPLHKEMEKLFTKHVRKIEEEYDNKVRLQKEQMEGLVKENEQLKKLLKKNPKYKNVSNNKQFLGKIKKVSESIFKNVINLSPTWGKNEWHCSNVRLDHYEIDPDGVFEEYIIMYPLETRFMIYQLITRIKRLERELETYDSHLNRWAKDIIIGKAPTTQIYGINFYDCPTTGKRCTMPFVEKIIEFSKPKALKTASEIKNQEMIASEKKYPKIRVNGGE